MDREKTEEIIFTIVEQAVRDWDGKKVSDFNQREWAFIKFMTERICYWVEEAYGKDK